MERLEVREVAPGSFGEMPGAAARSGNVSKARFEGVDREVAHGFGVPVRLKFSHDAGQSFGYADAATCHLRDKKMDRSVVRWAKPNVPVARFCKSSVKLCGQRDDMVGLGDRLKLSADEARRAIARHETAPSIIQPELLVSLRRCFAHACTSTGVRASKSTPASAAHARMSDILHFGMRPDCFQLETVVGARFSARATATVPPSASMICWAFGMAFNYDIRNFGARG